MIGFTTANRIPSAETSFLPMTILREDLLDPVFEAAAEATEEAVLSSLWAAESLTGYTGLYGAVSSGSPFSHQQTAKAPGFSISKRQVKPQERKLFRLGWFSGATVPSRMGRVPSARWAAAVSSRTMMPWPWKQGTDSHGIHDGGFSSISLGKSR